MWSYRRMPNGTLIGISEFLNRNDVSEKPLRQCLYPFRSREPKSIVKPLHSNPTDDEVHKYNEKLEAAKPKVVRHLILIRHGQYNLEGTTDDQRYLTEIGEYFKLQSVGARAFYINVILLLKR